MKSLRLLAIAMLCAPMVKAQSSPNPADAKPIFYTISFPNAVHHEAEFMITLPSSPSGPLKFRMSRSSAGRYATAEFGKNVYNVKATTISGEPLEVKQVEGDVYQIDEHPDALKITYTLFGNWTDGTYASIDPSHAHLNTPAAFMWIVGQDKRPLKFEFDDIEKYGWQVATQLKHEGANVYSAPNLQYMMDSPIELSAYKKASWEVTNTDGKKETINMAVHADDDQAVIDNFSKMVQKVVLEEKAVFGELPTYDFGEYTFLDDSYPTNSGDGMEHRNSTSIVHPVDKIAGNETRLLSTYAHEYFHSWNVKRIRPKSLEPFNFEHADMSSELWFAEGFTQYYGEMLLVRAGFHNVDDYGKTMSGLINSVVNAPSALKYPQTWMSRHAVYADAGVSIDPNNDLNIFTSYYFYGGATALALDLKLRSEFHITLDDYMRAVWLSVGKVMKPYTIPDLEKVLANVTKNPKFAADFFRNYIYGVEKADYAALLDKAGLILRKSQAGKAWAGPIYAAGQGRNRAGQARVQEGDGLALSYGTLQGTPVYKAGLDVGDIILKVDGKDIKSSADFTAAYADKKPGDNITVDYKNRTGAHQTTVTLEENPYLEVVTYEKADKTPTKEQLDFRNNWLSSKVK